MIGVVLVAAVSGPSAEPDPRVAAAMLTRMLDRVYRAVRIPHDRTAVEQLSDVLSDDLVEQVFEQNASAMSPSADDAPFVRISNVSVNQCATTTFEAMSEARFYCEWQVDGQVLHWGHRHERKMVLSGTIRMEVAEDGCRITGITMQSVKTLAKPTGT